MTISTILKHVMFSAAEAEIGSVFLNANNQQLYAQHRKKWDIHSHPHDFKLTTPLPWVTVMT
jgi:hypothetical protein